MYLLWLSGLVHINGPQLLPTLPNKESILRALLHLYAGVVKNKGTTTR